MTTNYTVQLYSEDEPQYFSSVATVREIGDSVHLYTESNQLIAILEKNDIQKFLPTSQNTD